MDPRAFIAVTSLGYDYLCDFQMWFVVLLALLVSGVIRYVTMGHNNRSRPQKRLG